MNRSWCAFWIFYITIQECLYYGQAQVIRKKIVDKLQLDQASITIRNVNNSDPILFLYNVLPCEHCDFDRLSEPVPERVNKTQTISTRYPYDIQLLAVKDGNTTLRCHIKSYKFAEHASYLFDVIETDQNETICAITQTAESSYFWTPIIVAIALLCFLVLGIQLCHVLYNSNYINRIRTNIGHQRLINADTISTLTTSPIINRRAPPTIHNEPQDDDIRNLVASSELPLVGSTRLSNNSIKITKILPKRLRSLDTFRGFSLMVMIFVNYGGGGYWFFDHSVWNGLTLADLVFPWFVWMMGVSIVLSQRSLLRKKISKRTILLKICTRTVILFFLGLLLQGGFAKPKAVRILGVLQRLALCYFFTALLILIFDEAEDETHSSQWPIGDDVQQPIRQEIYNTVLHFWPQWLSILCVTCAWIGITFIPKLNNCPRGYIGPGGKHEHGKYANCTGGVAGYLDRKILGEGHLYGYPTCKDVYDTQLPFDPEGLLGILTGTLLCYLGAQAGHSFAYSTRVRRVCMQWLVSGLICGFLGLVLSKGGQSESWIPINKNLWSLSFILVLAALAFVILTILYLLVDVWKVFTGEPWLWLGMNSIVVYVGHEVCDGRFPVQFQVDETHTQLLAMHCYGVAWWFFVAGIMYFKEVFIAI